MRTIARGRIPMRRPGTPGPRGGGVFVTELQRARLLDAAFAVVSEERFGVSLTPAGVGRERIPFRLTVRTHMVLSAVAGLSGEGADPNNREVSDAAGVSDQGQISKLLARLEGHGLLENTGGSTQGIARAWRLTSRGEEILRVGRPRGVDLDHGVGSSEVAR